MWIPTCDGKLEWESHGLLERLLPAQRFAGWIHLGLGGSGMSRWCWEGVIDWARDGVSLDITPWWIVVLVTCKRYITLSDQGLLKSTRSSKSSTSQVSNYWAYGGDFNDHPNDSNFNINGLLYPDRQLKAALIEAKYTQQPINIELDSIVSGRLSSSQVDLKTCSETSIEQRPVSSIGSVVLKIRNRLMFSSLSSFS